MYEDKKLKSAFRKAIRSYFEGKGYDNYSKANKNFRYTKKYFDRFEEEHFGSVKDRVSDATFKYNSRSK